MKVSQKCLKTCLRTNYLQLYLSEDCRKNELYYLHMIMTMQTWKRACACKAIFMGKKSLIGGYGFPNM